MNHNDRFGRVLRSLWNRIPGEQGGETVRFSDSSVRAFYNEPDELISFSSGSAELHNLMQMPPPIIVERGPVSPCSLREVPVEITDRFYDIPPELYAVLEPHLPELRTVFNRRNLHSELLVRLRSIDGRTLRLEKTSYYRSFVTNLCPDYRVGTDKTIRDLTRDLLLDTDETIRCIERSPFSNHLGGGGLVISHDGRVLFPIRTDKVTTSPGKMGLSFSGSMNYRSSDTTLWAMLSEEMTEEIGIHNNDIIDVYHLGVIRDMRWLGKPSVLSVVIGDKYIRYADISDENQTIIEFDLNLDYEIENIYDIVRHETVATLIRELSAYTETNRVDLSTNLISLLHFLNKYTRTK